MKSVTEYLDQSAACFPDKIAVIDQKRKLTFKEWKEEAFHIASYLEVYFPRRKSPVCFYLDKSAACLTVMLGIAYSGNFYTPLDTQMPVERIKKILQTLENPLLITDREHKAAVESFAENLDVFYLEDALATDYDEEKIQASVDKIIDTDVLYVLFTSGSTGNPKGVIIGHRSVIDYTTWVTNTFQINAKTIFGNQAPFYFDNSILDIYCTLKNGATLCIIPRACFLFPIKLLEYLQQHQVNTIFWVPSALCLVANLKALGKRHVDSLRKILFCGEVMPNKQLNQWRKEYPNALFANLYGPTEITDVCTSYIIDRVFADDDPLPIGTAAQNSDVFLLDEGDHLVDQAGKTGEICVRGTSLAYGYYNNPEKTKEAFVQNPLQKAYEEKIYRTGDLAKYNERGELMYLSRKDFQIKHMGRRIELGEIENIFSSLPEIMQCCCLYNTKESKIVLFYTGKIKEEVVLSAVKDRLLRYMMPNKVIRLHTMPLNLNGKIDRVKLKELL